MLYKFSEWKVLTKLLQYTQSYNQWRMKSKKYCNNTPPPSIKN